MNTGKRDTTEVSPRLSLVDGGGDLDRRAAIVPRSPFVRELPEGQLFQTQALGDAFDHAVQAAASAEQVVLVEGETGVGKTTFLRRLATVLGDNAEVCHVEARLALGERHLLAAIAEGFGCPPVGGSGELASMLARRGIDSRPPLIVVDNADRLSSFALAALFELKRKIRHGGGRLGMILSAKPGRLDAILMLPAFSTYNEGWLCRISLPPLNEQETAAYLEHRIEAAGMQDTVSLDAAQLRRVFRGSRGLPRYIDYLADDLLHGRRPRVYRRRRYRWWVERRAVWMPAAGFAVLVVGVAAILINLLLAEPPPARLVFDAPVPAAAALTGPRSPSPAADSQDVAGPTATAGSEGEVRGEAAADVDGGTAPAVQPEPRPVPEPPAINALEGRAWLMAQAPERYTVQLASTPDRELAAQFIEKNPLAGKTTVVPTRRGDRILYLVIYGSFDGSKQAGDAIAALPERIRRNQPFSRTMSSLQAITAGP